MNSAHTARPAALTIHNLVLACIACTKFSAEVDERNYALVRAGKGFDHAAFAAASAWAEALNSSVDLYTEKEQDDLGLLRARWATAERFVRQDVRR